jgi:hypothetical protein
VVGSQITEVVNNLLGWVDEAKAAGLSIVFKDLIDAHVSDPKEQLKYRAVGQKLITAAREGKNTDNIKRITVWGEGFDDPNIEIHTRWENELLGRPQRPRY